MASPIRFQAIFPKEHVSSALLQICSQLGAAYIPRIVSTDQPLPEPPLSAHGARAGPSGIWDGEGIAAVLGLTRGNFLGPPSAQGALVGPWPGT